MEDAIMLNNGEDCVYLPPGFRFYPTDEEIITNYLLQKVTNPNFTAEAVGEVDLNKCEPWQLPSRAKMGEKEWYFFCQKDKKYPTGFRINRATASGYWKATGKDKEIHKGKRELVGMKKTLVFYKGRAPHGEKTNWVMHEFRLQGSSSKHQSPESQRSCQKDDWVVCKVFHKGIILGQCSHNMNSNACYFEVPEINYPNCSNPSKLSTSFNSLTPLPEQPSMLPQAPDAVNLVHMHNEEQLVLDAAQWYYNVPNHQYDSRIFSSDGNVDSHWNF